MNSLLLRQIRKHLPDDLISEKRLENFYAAINQSYTNYDDQLKMSQRAMIISSDELFQANKKLKEDAEIQKGIIENLNYIVRILKLGETSEHELDLDGKVDLAKFIKKQSKEILKINKQQSDTIISDTAYVSLRFILQILMNYVIPDKNIDGEFFKFNLPTYKNKDGKELKILPVTSNKYIISSSDKVIFPTNELPALILPQEPTEGVEPDDEGWCQGSSRGGGNEELCGCEEGCREAEHQLQRVPFGVSRLIFAGMKRSGEPPAGKLGVLFLSGMVLLPLDF